MTEMLLERGVSQLFQPHCLQVRRQDIEFRNIDDGCVQIRVTVANTSHLPSPPAYLTLQSAPLGAFVAWKHLARLSVPAIEPGGSVTVIYEAEVADPAPLGDFSRVPPRKLLTALGADDESPSNNDDSAVGLLDRGPRSRRRLASDPFSLLSRKNLHWAGNINVLIGAQAVERHLAQALRIYAGRTNLAMFFIGERSDEYQFALAGSGVAWNPKLYNGTECRSLLAGHSADNEIAPAQWIPIRGRGLVLLAIEPPADCPAGEIQVHVLQRSTGRDAFVEFSLDPRAAGAGCYVV